MKKKNNLQSYQRNHLFLSHLANPLPISQSLIGWGHKKMINLSMALEVLFLQDSVIQILLKIAFEVLFLQDSMIQLHLKMALEV